MKKITATFLPFKLDEVREAIGKIEGLDIDIGLAIEAKSYGKYVFEPYRGAEYAVDFLPKVIIEVVVDDRFAQQVENAIVKAARTGRPSDDGKVRVEDNVVQCVDIGTGEVFEGSLQRPVRVIAPRASGSEPAAT